MRVPLRTVALTLLTGVAAACGGGSSGPTGPAMPTTASIVHRALPTNTLGSLTTLDLPLVDGDPNAFLIVTPVLVPADLVYANHAIGVRYLGAKWLIEYADLASVPSAASFHVTASTTAVADSTRFGMHTTSAGNIDVTRTFIDHPSTNANPSAIILLTHNASPGGAAGPSHDHPTGLVYDAASGRWAIYNRDSATMPVGVAFNFAVVGMDASGPFSEGAYSVSSPGNISGGATYPGLGAAPSSIVHATPVYDPTAGAAFTGHHGVIYDGALNWGVFSQAATPFPAGMGCNVAAGTP